MDKLFGEYCVEIMRNLLPPSSALLRISPIHKLKDIVWCVKSVYTGDIQPQPIAHGGLLNQHRQDVKDTHCTT